MPKLHEEKVNVLKKPEWLKIRLHRTAEYADVQRIVRDHSLHTICSSGLCPNKAECWSRRTATFMILGEICTRNCRFCATLSGRPLPPDPSEPAKLAECVRAIRAENPDVTIELLIPDLDAKPDLLDTVIASGPDIIGHNIETTEQLTPLVRSRARYRTSLDVLRYLSEKGAVAKSGLMVGLGESDEEVLQTLRDLHAAGVEIVTLGQYLRPTLEHHPVAAYITPEKFDWYRQQALDMGFSYCASGPMVRSSYLADEALGSVRLKRQVSAKA